MVRGVEPERPPGPVLPADSKRELEEGTDAHADHDHYDPDYYKTGHDNLPVALRSRLRIPCEPTSRMGPDARAIWLVWRVPAYPKNLSARLSPMLLMIQDIRPIPTCLNLVIPWT